MQEKKDALVEEKGEVSKNGWETVESTYRGGNEHHYVTTQKKKRKMYPEKRGKGKEHRMGVTTLKDRARLSEERSCQVG